MTTSLELDPAVQTPTAVVAEAGPTIGRRMKITCTRDELLAKLQIVGRGVSTRSSVQILSGIMVRADSAEQPVELCSTDMEISLRAPLVADVNEPGQTVLPGRLVLDIARRLPAQPITVDQQNGVARLECGASEYRLHTYLAEDFPRLPEVDRERLFAVDRKVFLETAEQVMRAASKDESRPVLTGILVELGGGTVTMAATDSYRMAVKTSQLQSGPPEELRPIVPARALAELVRIAPLVGGEELEVAVEQNQVLFGMNGVWLSARRIDGQFPSYKQLLPDAFEHDVVLNRAELIEVLSRMELLAHRNSPLRLRFSPGEVTVSAQTQEVGEGRETIPCDFRGEPLEVGFNAGFLRDGVESVDEEQVHLKLINPLRPGLVTGEADDYWYLVMPIRLSS
jgi:DNA polymerase III subunit beta